MQIGMVCPSCSSALDDEGFCEHCDESLGGIGSDATAVAPEVQVRSTMAYNSRGAVNESSATDSSFTTLNSSREMSVGATLPGAEGAAVASAKSLPEVMADDTNIGMTSAMIGQQLGSYRLLEVLGEGGMGRVYLAEHTKIGRRVALKMLHTHLASSPDVVRRFFDEARAVNRILHEHIVEITDFIENDGGDNYFIMEYLRGAPLNEVLARENNVSSLARSLSIGVQVASALSAVHVANIVHRDLKPENIFLTERGGQKDFVKLLDFGIAKLMGSHGGELNLRKTEAGVIMGTPAYMSPEQASAKSVDHRTDIYALGVILYELCTGVLPFVADNFGDLVVMHKTQTPTLPSKVPGLLQEIPPPLDELIMRCLAKRPEDRPQSSKEVEAQLHEIAWEFAVELENFDISAGFIGRRQGKGRGRLRLIAGVGVAAAVALAFTQMSSTGSPRGDQSAAAIASASLADAAPPRDNLPVTAPQIELSFTSEPPGAMVFSVEDDSALLGITPFTLAFDKEQSVSAFEFRKPGFERATQETSLLTASTVTAVLAAKEELPPVVLEDEKPASKAKERSRSRRRKADKEQDTKPPPRKQTYREGAVLDPFAN